MQNPLFRAHAALSPSAPAKQREPNRPHGTVWLLAGFLRFSIERTHYAVLPQRAHDHMRAVRLVDIRYVLGGEL